MPKFQIAHVNEQGTDLLIVPLDPQFGRKTSPEQQAILADIQTHAIGADLRGTVVPVWDAGSGSMDYLAPSAWHPFFSSINLQWVAARLNRELSWP